MELNIVYEDSSLIIFDKPQGLAAAPGKSVSLTELVFEKYPLLAGVKGYKQGEGGLLNRLDNETGGLVVFAKSNTSFIYYSNQMKNEKILKTYIAVVEGRVSEKSGVIDKPIAHHQKSAKKMVIAEAARKYRGKSQDCITRWELVDYKDGQSVLKVRITKGVRHQIRVHLASIGHPIVNDAVYHKTADVSTENSHHLLYACSLDFTTPEGETVNVNVDAAFLQGNNYTNIC